MTDSPADGPARGRPGCVLAIETSWRVASVALEVDGALAARRFLAERREHGARIVPAVAEVLEEAGVAAGDLEAVVAGAGPGSFTGVRTGAAVAKALAAALAVPLHAASSLAAGAVAREALGPASGVPPELQSGPAQPSAASEPSSGAADIRYVLFDARRGRVYGACYQVGDAGRPAEVIAPHGGTIVDVINSRPPLGTIFAGAGAVAHERLLLAAGHAVAPPPAGCPVAAALLLCCDWTPVSVADWEPGYLRAWRPG